jgi:DNA-binding phage protein
MIKLDSLPAKLYLALNLDMTSAEQAKAIVDAIASEAKDRWGDRWIAELVRAYCEIETAETGKEVKPVARRSQLVRAIELATPTLETLLRLAAAVDMELQAVITRKEVKRF